MHTTNYMPHIIIIVLVIIIVLIIFLFSLTHDKVFPPARHLYREKDKHYKKFSVGKINGRLYHNGSNVLVIHCHGNTGNITQRSYVEEICREIGWNLIIFDYSGYGESRGSSCTRGILLDALRVYDYARKYYSDKHIMLWGESLGGGPAAYVASHRKCGSLVLFSTYSSLTDVVKYNPSYQGMSGHFLGKILQTMVGNICTKNFLCAVRCPVTIVHSQEDTFINIRNAEINQQHCPEAHLIRINGDHSEPHITPGEMAQLLNSLPSPFCKHLSDDCLQRICHSLRWAARKNKLNADTKVTDVTLPLHTPTS